jgi:GNAT superfamily N-acetyltransferase
MQIRAYHHATDEETLLKLWAAVFGEDWPLDAALFRREAVDVPTYRPGDHLLAEMDEKIVGFALTQVGMGAPPRGSLLAMGVHPDYRRRGLGRALHAAALARLRERGAEHAQLGAGALGYLWPGVPAERCAASGGSQTQPAAPNAWTFFAALGWPEVERSFDLARALDDYQTPAWAWERVNAREVTLTQAGPRDETRVVEFVMGEEPGWARYFTQAFQEGRAADVVLARAAGGAILGAALAEDRLARWSRSFAQPVGAPGCVLTAQAARGRGIGMALSARASEILKERGCRTSFIGWTWLVDWYGKLGYQAWQEYVMSWTRLERLKTVEKLRAGRARLAGALSNITTDRPVLANGWTAREWLAHLGGWENRIADAYQALAAGKIPDWELDHMTLDEVNARMLQESPDTTLAAARAGEERAHRRLETILRGAPDADLFDPARFAWMKGVPFAEWIRNNSCEHVEEHLLDWI